MSAALSVIAVREFGASDSQILSPFADQRHAVWDVTGGGRLYPLIGTGKHGEERAVFSRDFRKIATANADTFGRVWDAQTGQLLVACGHDGWVIHARFNPAGDRLVTTVNGSVEAQIWNLQTGQRERLLHGHHQPLWYADFSPDGQRVVATDFEGEAAIWNVATGDRLHSFTRHTAWVRCAVFSPDSRWVATASGDHTARVWEADTGREVIPPLRHGDHVMRVRFSPDGRWLVTACLDGTVHIWDVLTGQRALSATCRPGAWTTCPMAA